MSNPWENFQDPHGLVREALTALKPPSPAEDLRAMAQQAEDLAARLRRLADDVEALFA
jgi:hypothetical protein